jgi:hypothetical protein
MLNSGPAVAAMLSSGQQQVPVVDWSSPETFAMPSQNAAEAPQTSSPAAGLLYVAAGALAGYASYMAFRPATVMLGTGGAATTEERAKRAWLASLDAPSWGPAAGKSSSRRSAGRVVRTQTHHAGGLSDDHTHLDEVFRSSHFGRVPMATVKPAVELPYDDHSGNLAARLSTFGRVPMATVKPAPKTPDDDHKYPGARLAGSGFGRVPMATAEPVGRVRPTARQSAGTSEERAKRAWLASLDQPSWGKK